MEFKDENISQLQPVFLSAVQNQVIILPNAKHPSVHIFGGKLPALHHIAFSV